MAKMSAPSRERQIMAVSYLLGVGQKNACGLNFYPKRRRFVDAHFGCHASFHFDRHYGLDRVRDARARHWRGQIRKMESAQSARARTRSNGSGASGKNAQPDASGAGNGSAPGIDATI